MFKKFAAAIAIAVTASFGSVGVAEASVVTTAKVQPSMDNETRGYEQEGNAKRVSNPLTKTYKPVKKVVKKKVVKKAKKRVVKKARKHSVKRSVKRAR